MSLVAVLDTGLEDTSLLLESMQEAGAKTLLTSNRDEILGADGFIIHSSTDFSSFMKALENSKAPELIDKRLAGGKAVLGIGTGLQVMFENHAELEDETSGLAQWPGVLKGATANGDRSSSQAQISAAIGSKLFAGLENDLFWFENSLGVFEFTLQVDPPFLAPAVSYLRGSSPFIAAVENGPLSAVQFHPERSGDAGLALLRNWLGTI